MQTPLDLDLFVRMGQEVGSGLGVQLMVSYIGLFWLGLFVWQRSWVCIVGVAGVAFSLALAKACASASASAMAFLMSEVTCQCKDLDAVEGIHSAQGVQGDPNDSNSCILLCCTTVPLHYMALYCTTLHYSVVRPC